MTRVENMESAPPEMTTFMPSVEVIDKMHSPRVIKSHLPFFLLPSNLLDTCKVNNKYAVYLNVHLLDFDCLIKCLCMVAIFLKNKKVKNSLSVMISHRC